MSTTQYVSQPGGAAAMPQSYMSSVPRPVGATTTTTTTSTTAYQQPRTTTTTTSYVSRAGVPGSAVLPEIVTFAGSPLASGPVVLTPPDQLLKTGGNRAVVVSNNGRSSGVDVSVRVAQTPAFSELQVMNSEPEKNPRDWVTVPMQTSRDEIQLRPRGFSFSESSCATGYSTDWDVKSRYMMAMRTGPTECPDHLLAKSRLFPREEFTSPYVLYYFDETAPNDTLLRNDVIDPAKREKHSKKGKKGLCGGGGGEASRMRSQSLGASKNGSSSSSSTSSTSSSTSSTSSTRSVSVERSKIVPAAAYVAPVAAVAVAQSRATSRPIVSNPGYNLPKSPVIYQQPIPMAEAPRNVFAGSPMAQEQYYRSALMGGSQAPYGAYTTTTTTTLPRINERGIECESVSKSSRSRSTIKPTKARVLAKGGLPCCTSARYVSASSSGFRTGSVTNWESQKGMGARYDAVGYSTYQTGVPQNGGMGPTHNPPSYPYANDHHYGDESVSSSYTSSYTHTSKSRSRSRSRSTTAKVASKAPTASLKTKCCGGGNARYHSTNSNGHCESCSSATSSSSSSSSSSTSYSSSDPIVVSTARGGSSRSPVVVVSNPSRGLVDCCRDRKGNQSYQEYHSAASSGSSSSTSTSTSSSTSSSSGQVRQAAPRRVSVSASSRGGDSSSTSESSSYDNPYVGTINSRGAMTGSRSTGSVSSKGSVYPEIQPSAKPNHERDTTYAVRKMFFDVDEMRVPEHGTALKMLPTFSTSYRNYPVLAYDVIAPNAYHEFFKPRKCPGLFA